MYRSAACKKAGKRKGERCSIAFIIPSAPPTLAAPLSLQTIIKT
jgi:hypothetical protein